MTMWRVPMACWIPTATDTHSEYVILPAFPLRQLSHECASVLCYTYIACLIEHIIYKSLNCCVLRCIALECHLRGSGTQC